MSTQDTAVDISEIETSKSHSSTKPIPNKAKAVPFWLVGLLIALVFAIFFVAAMIYKEYANQQTDTNEEKTSQVENIETPGNTEELMPFDLPDQDSQSKQAHADKPDTLALIMDVSAGEIDVSDITLDDPVTGEGSTSLLNTDEAVDTHNISDAENNEIDVFAADVSESVSEDDLNPIVIRPPSEEGGAPKKIEQLQATHDAVASALKDYQAQEIVIVKSSMELQEQAKTRLKGLITQLGTLEDKLNKQIERDHAPKKRAHTTISQPQPVKADVSFSLVGVDLWGGERFAQIEHQGSLQLLATGEAVDGWVITKITSQGITVKNNKGVLINVTQK